MDRRLLLCVLLAGCAAAPLASSNGGDLFFSYDAAVLETLPDAHDGEDPATAGQLIGWDTRLMDTVRRLRLPPTAAARLYASVAVAQRDALLLGAGARGVDAVGAIVACELAPKGCEGLRSVLEPSPRELALASAVADRVHARLEEEKRAAVKPTPPPPGPAVWTDVSATTPDAGTWLPFASGSTVLFPPPPAAGTPEDLADLAAVKEAVQGATDWHRTRAEHWSGGLGTETPAGMWIGIAHDTLLRHGVDDVAAVAQLRATLAAAMADSFVNCWRAKFTYWTARPSKRDTSILPSVPLPLFPSYPSGHSTISGAAATILSAAFPKDSSRLTALAREAADSRLWAGIHFPNDNDRGLAVGRETALRVLQDPRFALAPLR